jgi:ribonuclease PH
LSRQILPNNSVIQRRTGRAVTAARPVTLSYDPYGHADASVLYELGDTKVLVSVTMQDGVPPFMRNKGSGWLTAEYAMLPTATRTRTTREASMAKRKGRSVEISRLIGRCLRSVVDLSCFGEKTLIIDCDVLQADGGTRTACITAASIALTCASERWVAKGKAERSVLREPIAALSAGIVDGELMVDLDNDEDNQAETDFNFVMTQSGKIIELQGTAEKNPMGWDDCIKLKEMTEDALSSIFTL